MQSVIERLEGEWERLAVDRRAARRLRAVCEAAEGAETLGEVKQYVCQAEPADADRVLLALVRRAGEGEPLAARVLLQLLLPESASRSLPCTRSTG